MIKDDCVTGKCQLLLDQCVCIFCVNPLVYAALVLVTVLVAVCTREFLKKGLYYCSHLNCQITRSLGAMTQAGFLLASDVSGSIS